MNYLREIIAFEKQMRRQPLSTTAQLLWYKLMQFANGLYWPEKFQIDNDRLLELVNVRSRTTIISARKELEECGYLMFTPGAKGKPSLYQMISAADKEPPSLPEFYGENTVKAPDDFLRDIRDEGDITRYFGWTEDIGKQLAETTTAIFREFAPNLSPTAEDQRRVFYLILQQDCDENGFWTITFPEEKKELLAHAFDIARSRHAVTWAYINGIYKNFATRGIKTREDALRYEANRETNY